EPNPLLIKDKKPNMFKKFKLNTLLLFIPLMSLMFCFNAPQNDDEKMQTIMVSVKNTLSYLHYSPKPINDAYSQQVYDKYFEMIDFGKDISCSRIWKNSANTKPSLTII